MRPIAFVLCAARPQRLQRGFQAPEIQIPFLLEYRLSNFGSNRSLSDVPPAAFRYLFQSRTIAAGCRRNLHRVHVMDVVILGYTGEGQQQRRAFSLQRDLRALSATLAELGEVVAVVIDPITAYLGDVDSHRNAEVSIFSSKDEPERGRG